MTLTGATTLGQSTGLETVKMKLIALVTVCKIYLYNLNVGYTLIVVNVWLGQHLNHLTYPKDYLIQRLKYFPIPFVTE